MQDWHAIRQDRMRLTCVAPCGRRRRGRRICVHGDGWQLLFMSASHLLAGEEDAHLRPHFRMRGAWSSPRRAPFSPHFRRGSRTEEFSSATTGHISLQRSLAYSPWQSFVTHLSPCCCTRHRTHLENMIPCYARAAGHSGDRTGREHGSLGKSRQRVERPRITSNHLNYERLDRPPRRSRHVGAPNAERGVA